MNLIVARNFRHIFNVAIFYSPSTLRPGERRFLTAVHPRTRKVRILLYCPT